MLREKIYHRICLLIAFVLIVLVGLCSFKKTEVYINKHLRLLTKTLLPQSWDFYASDPQQPRFDLYSVSANNNYDKITGKHGCQFFSRKDRRTDIGLSFLVNDLNGTEWRELHCSSVNLKSSLMTSTEKFPVVVMQKEYDHIPPGKYILARYNCPTREEYRADVSRNVSVIQLELK